MSDLADAPYAERMQRLEAIVERLQKGVDLDETMKLFEEGTRIYESCQKTIAEVETRIEASEPIAVERRRERGECKTKSEYMFCNLM